MEGAGDHPIVLPCVPSRGIIVLLCNDRRREELRKSNKWYLRRSRTVQYEHVVYCLCWFAYHQGCTMTPCSICRQYARISTVHGKNSNLSSIYNVMMIIVLYRQYKNLKVLYWKKKSESLYWKKNLKVSYWKKNLKENTERKNLKEQSERKYWKKKHNATNDR